MLFFLSDALNNLICLVVQISMHALNVISFGFSGQQAHEFLLLFFHINIWISFGHAAERIGTKTEEIAEDIIDFLGFGHPSVEHLAATWRPSWALAVNGASLVLKSWCIYRDHFPLTVASHNSLSLGVSTRSP